MRVLITGAAGRTGIAVMKALRKKKNDVIIRAFVHRPEQSEIAAAAGADEIVAGNMEELSGLKKALAGVDRVYHICPAFHPEEDRIGIDFSELCSDMGTERFVYHSVLHSIAPDLVHHARKLRVEQALTGGSMPYAIIQNGCLMQNLLMSLNDVKSSGIWRQRFFDGRSTRMNFVDLADVAEAAATVLLDDDHLYATYELCGPENLSEQDILSAMSTAFGREVRSEFIPDEAFVRAMTSSGAPANMIDEMIIMYSHYQKSGFMGCSGTLSRLLGRHPDNIGEFFQKNS